MEDAMITRLGHTTLFVLDQAKAFDIYVNVLGMKVNTDVIMEGGMRWLTVTAPKDPNLEIVLSEPKPPILEKEAAELVRSLLERNAMGAGVWECDDCHATYQELKAKGIEFTKEPTTEFYGIEAVFKDGCGNWFSLTQRTSQGG
jgi:catechol 2,3-dioxygenase-like lactoylglutathione lyase family enzyme